MPADESLTERIRALLARRRGVTEKRMFGGRAFLLHGSIVCSAKAKEMFVAVGDVAYDRALAKPRVRPMLRGGRPLRGYVYVATEALRSDAALRAWVELGVAEAKRKQGP